MADENRTTSPAEIRAMNAWMRDRVLALRKGGWSTPHAEWIACQETLIRWGYSPCLDL